MCVKLLLQEGVRRKGPAIPPAQLTQVFANVLNLKDRSSPWPLAVTTHFLDTRPSTALVRRFPSDPSENLGVAAAMTAVLEYGRVVKARELSCRGNAVVGTYLGNRLMVKPIETERWFEVAASSVPMVDRGRWTTKSGGRGVAWASQG